MSRHSFVYQPDGFRSDADAPDWIWFPNLRLILGWGDGLWQTLSTRLMGVRHVFFFLGDAPPRPAIGGLLDCRQRHFDYSPLQGIEPPLMVEASSRTVVMRYELNGEGRAEAKPSHCPGGLHVIVPDGEYAVRHCTPSDDDPSFLLCRRERTLKPRFQAKLAELGLKYESGVGKRDTRPDGLRTSAEQEFAAWAAQFKRGHIEKRTQELLKDPASRPADFDAMKAAHVRARAGAIQRGKRDSKGRPQRPYAEEHLVAYTCGEVARREAGQLMFDARWRELASFSKHGFVIAEG